MINRIKQFAILAAMLPLVGACAAVNLDDVSSMEIDSWPFAKALHQEYIDLAYMEAAENDWDDASYFGAKALAAVDASAEGSALPAPQPLSERDIPAVALGTLANASDSLEAVIDDGRRNKPQAAARAQAMFDCWMQEQEENFQPDDIAACRKAFEIAMKAMTKMAAAAPAMAAPAAPSGEAMKAAGPFMVYFGHNSGSLDSAASALLSNLAKHAFAQDSMGYIVLTGHADLSGSKAYNEALAERRVMAVEKALMDNGISAKVLVSSYGETRPLQSTDDGVREPKNRRVEINLSR